RLPNETNFPLADGTLTTNPSVGTGTVTLTDLDATHVNALYGQRPGFDPRMNDFPYELTFLATGFALPVQSISSDILSFANPNPTKAGLTIGPKDDPTAKPTDFNLTSGKVVFSGTPDQATAGDIAWKEAEIQLTGLPQIGQTWKLSLTTGGTTKTFSTK